MHWPTMPRELRWVVMMAWLTITKQFSPKSESTISMALHLIVNDRDESGHCQVSDNNTSRGQLYCNLPDIHASHGWRDTNVKSFFAVADTELWKLSGWKPIILDYFIYTLRISVQHSIHSFTLTLTFNWGSWSVMGAWIDTHTTHYWDPYSIFKTYTLSVPTKS